MSRLIDNSAKRKELLKHMILQLHKGDAPGQVRHRLEQLLGSIPYGEVVEVEQELIAEGLPQEEVLKFCDLHTRALEGRIDLTGMKTIPPGHPADTFMKENRELVRLTAQIEDMLQNAAAQEDRQIPDTVMKLRSRFNALWDVDKHYRRKENLSFPFWSRKASPVPRRSCGANTTRPARRCRRPAKIWPAWPNCCSCPRCAP